VATWNAVLTTPSKIFRETALKIALSRKMTEKGCFFIEKVLPQNVPRGT